MPAGGAPGAGGARTPAASLKTQTRGDTIVGKLSAVFTRLSAHMQASSKDSSEKVGFGSVWHLPVMLLASCNDSCCSNCDKIALDYGFAKAYCIHSLSIVLFVPLLAILRAGFPGCSAAP